MDCEGVVAVTLALGFRYVIVDFTHVKNIDHSSCLTFEDLKQMEKTFRSYPDIFSSSWNNGIFQKIEGEIDHLGQQARIFVKDLSTATSKLEDFRRCIFKLGFVLLELATFKEHAKKVVSEVLELCLTNTWGYSYLFDFGLSLQRSDDNRSEDEALVAQVILSEFVHFKEVLTMVWNEETIQKPVEDTVNNIEGKIWDGRSTVSTQIAKSSLLDSFYTFDTEYKRLLGSYLPEDADLDALVHKINEIARTLYPVSSESGWERETIENIPVLLAGIFAVFTILKSGSSYNRAESAGRDEDLGEKLLMRPHNIQVLTLLCMFGCGSCSTNSLESQLMQIRTGEGKSMILGAAAVLLALFGFRVRCVCYSEYLSSRDYQLFLDVFEKFGLTRLIKYSTITKLSEDSTSSKGDIRVLTEHLLKGKLSGVFQQKYLVHGAERREQKMLRGNATKAEVDGRERNLSDGGISRGAPKLESEKKSSKNKYNGRNIIIFPLANKGN